jgi:hypothetical protein
MVAPKGRAAIEGDAEAAGDGSGFISVIYCGVCGVPPEYCEFGHGGG